MENNESLELDGAQLEKRRRSRISLVMLAAIAFVPLFIAYGMFFFLPEMAPEGTTNEGTLIQPPVTLAEVSAEVDAALPKGKWLMLMPVATQCGPECEETLYLARQVNVGLNKDSDRVLRVLAVEGDALSAPFRELVEIEHSDAVLYFDTSAAISGALASMAPNEPGQLVFLVDPVGNIIMFYRGDQLGKPMLKDLKHLLRVSKLG